MGTVSAKSGFSSVITGIALGFVFGGLLISMNSLENLRGEVTSTQQSTACQTCTDCMASASSAGTAPSQECTTACYECSCEFQCATLGCAENGCYDAANEICTCGFPSSPPSPVEYCCDTENFCNQAGSNCRDAELFPTDACGDGCAQASAAPTEFYCCDHEAQCVSTAVGPCTGETYTDPECGPGCGPPPSAPQTCDQIADSEMCGQGTCENPDEECVAIQAYACICTPKVILSSSSSSACKVDAQACTGAGQGNCCGGLECFQGKCEPLCCNANLQCEPWADQPLPNP